MGEKPEIISKGYLSLSFVYIRSEKDILKLVNTLIANTKGEGEKSAEDFWVKAERLLYCALVGYIWYEAPAEEMNFITLLELINASEAREDDEEYQSPVDLLFADLEERDPDHFAVKQYRKYKLAAGKTAKSILISCGARLAPFDIKELRDLMSYDELELDTLGDRKTALFLIMSDTDSTFNFVIAMLQSQLFNYQKLGKELMTQDEIAVMDGGKCILQLRGVRPFFSDKYDITQHPNYKYLSDFDKKNAFDVERYMSTRPAIVKPDEPFDIYEIDLSDEDAAAE